MSTVSSLKRDSFWLMHRSEKVALLRIDLVTGALLDVLEHRDLALVPFGARLSEENFKKWWMMRAVPSTRKGIRETLDILNMPSTQSMLVANLGLSLTDHYWINPDGSDFTWESVNLYTNDFSDAIGEFQFIQNGQVLNLCGRTTFCPSASLQGELRKKWLVGENGKRYLVKGNYGMSCQQSLNEVFATKIHHRQGIVPYTKYLVTSIDTTEGKGIGCISENFTTKEAEFISAYEIVSSCKKRNDCSEYETFIRVCVENGLPEDKIRQFLEYQILSDFVLSNCDRHFNNFGILRDSSTLKFISPAPIFDSGNSLFFNFMSVPDGVELLKLPANSFRKREVDLLKYIRNRGVLSLQKLPPVSELTRLLSLDENVSPARIKKIAKAYERKIELAAAFQKGESLNALIYGKPLLLGAQAYGEAAGKDKDFMPDTKEEQDIEQGVPFLGRDI